MRIEHGVWGMRANGGRMEPGQEAEGRERRTFGAEYAGGW